MYLFYLKVQRICISTYIVNLVYLVILYSSIFYIVLRAGYSHHTNVQLN